MKVRAFSSKGSHLEASDIDIVYVYGYGFPAASRGPMHYANEVGFYFRRAPDA